LAFASAGALADVGAIECHQWTHWGSSTVTATGDTSEEEVSLR
jgi:hypothetical protein